MRIVIASQTYDPHVNGQGAFAVHLARGLAEVGHDVLVIAPGPDLKAAQWTEAGVCVQGVPAIPLVPFAPQVHVTPLPAPTVRRALDNFGPQIVNIEDHYPLCRRVAMEIASRGIPLVATNHFLPENMLAEVALFRVLSGFFRPLLWRTLTRVFRLADMATTPTETAADILRQQGMGVSVQAISCGIDRQRFRLDPTVDRGRIRRRYGLSCEGTVLLYVGRLAREKRLDVLVRALSYVEEDDVTLCIAGRGADRQDLESLTRELGLEDRVILTGFVPDADLPALLNSADIFCMPSEAELQSIATLEAMATGRPILAADARALPELVRPGVNGYLFAPGDSRDAARCIQKLVAQRDRWASMGRASLEMVQAHDLRNTIREYEALYTSLISGSRGPS